MVRPFEQMEAREVESFGRIRACCGPAAADFAAGPQIDHARFAHQRHVVADRGNRVLGVGRLGLAASVGARF